MNINWTRRHNTRPATPFTNPIDVVLYDLTDQMCSVY